MKDVKCPEVHVRLIGEDGNGFAIIARTMRAMRDANVKAKTVSEYQMEAMSGDYDHLLRTTMEYVNVD